jgi:lipopolysaccharide biosynthesis glycosyltransferase
LKVTPAEWTKWKSEFQGSKPIYIYERNTRETCNSIRRPNQKIRGIVEGEEVVTNKIIYYKIYIIVNKITAENFQNLKK